MLNLLKIVAAILGCLMVADIVGVMDVGSPRYWSAPLPYVIWVVLGVFTALMAYNAAGAWTAADPDKEWTEQPGASRRGAIIVGIAVLEMLALSALFYWLFWSRRVAAEYFVPDSAPHTIVFFVSVGGSMLFFHRLLTSVTPASRR